MADFEGDRNALKPYDEFENKNFDRMQPNNNVNFENVDINNVNVKIADDRGYYPEAGEPAVLQRTDSLAVDEQAIANAATLDEPISQTLRRDIVMIGRKIKHVLWPNTNRERFESLKDWDLWGPLIFCLLLGVMLSFDSNAEGDLIFGIVFMIFWGGSVFVTLNSRLLKGTTTFFQSMCLLGYCVFPLLISCLISIILSGFTDNWVRVIVVVPGLLYSIYASSGFLALTVPPEKKIISVYPALLLYLFVAWLIIICQLGLARGFFLFV
eukprot:TRINITY_DN4518_c0_g3_i3.p1 TRINITY_DN4518_c0_g3~~TRINITY_DN4518_c0_g3_i3.p1  ORF type:complete len:268 (+),score=31.06 TRINITY_DN4518_c0_g3_i3:200-1003(+)